MENAGEKDMSIKPPNQYDRMSCSCGWVGYRIRAVKVLKQKEAVGFACPMCLQQSLVVDEKVA